MKALGLLLLLFALPAWADNVTSKNLVDVGGGNKAVVFEETISPDGRYAIGWTLIPHKKSAKPIDWSLWKPGDDDAIDKFIQTYASYLPASMDNDTDYELINCVIDLKEKKLLQLPTEDPDFPHKNRGFMVAAWSPIEKGTRYAMVESDARYWTENLWLLTFDSSGMHQIDIIANLQKAVSPIIAEKRPMARNSYDTVFSVGPDAESGTTALAFQVSTVTFPFSSDLGKSSDDNSEILGSVTVKLSDGTVLKATSSTEGDNPFKDKPQLAKADRQLNQVYGQLSQKLSPDQRADLKKEQLDWIEQRDSVAAQALYASQGDASAHDPRDARDKSLLDSTQKRVKELQTRLDALH